MIEDPTVPDPIAIPSPDDLLLLHSNEDGTRFWHWCPACQDSHIYAVIKPFHNGAKWTFNASMEKPTFTPSMKISWQMRDDPEHVCHYFITEGKIEYCSDCTHHMKGQTVDLTPPPEGWSKHLGN
jgi:hypothetical protein